MGCDVMWLLQEPHGVTTQKTTLFAYLTIPLKITRKYCVSASLKMALEQDYQKFWQRLVTAAHNKQDPNKTNKQTPWPLVSERTIPTEQPPLVDEI
jgi:uncharacterized membrane-anchored protein YhcB (DUF1043 family)